MVGSIGLLLKMNLILKPLDNPNDPVWSVIFMVFLSVCMALYVIYYILGVDERESHGSHDTTEQEELLQLPSDGDQSCP
jgi:archaellum biogenesis protein FlaJ (TadC family)